MRWRGIFWGTFGALLFSTAAAPPSSALHTVGELWENSRWPYASEKGSYRSREVSSGKTLWEVTWAAKVSRGEHGSSMEIQENGRGTPWKFDEPIIWERKMVVQVAPDFQVKSVEGTRWTQEGQFLNQVKLQAEPERKRILYEDKEVQRGVGASSEAVVISWNPQILPDELLFHWIRTVEFHENPAGECVLLVSPKRRFRVRATLEGAERIVTPAGSFFCYRLDLSPRLGPMEILPIKKMLVPKMTLWCMVEPPHAWVKYQGPIGGPGSPEAVMELMKWWHSEVAG